MRGEKADFLEHTFYFFDATYTVVRCTAEQPSRRKGSEMTSKVNVGRQGRHEENRLNSYIDTHKSRSLRTAQRVLTASSVAYFYLARLSRFQNSHEHIQTTVIYHTVRMAGRVKNN